MRVVGIDASTNKTGISLFLDGQYVEHTLVDKHKTKEAMSRVPEMMVGICEVLSQYQPDKVVMEESMMTTNISTVKLLSYIAGAVIGWCAEHNVEFHFFMPSEWRKRIGLTQSNKIKREELKAEAINLVKKLYSIDVTDDESEAILIGKAGSIIPKKFEDDDFDI